jgi:hypothetical protein
MKSNRTAPVAFAAMLLISGCGTTATTPVTITPVTITPVAITPANVAEAQNAITGLTKLYADIQVDFPNVAPKGSSADNDISAALTAANATIAALPALAAAADQGTSLSAIASDATQVLNLLAADLPPGTLPSDVMLGLQAAEIIIPDLVAVASTVGTPTTGALPLTQRFAAPGMTVAQAKVTLEGVR